MDTTINIRALIALKQLKDLMDASDKELKRERTMWVSPFLAKREVHILEAHLLKDILWEENDNRHFCLLDIQGFEKILGMVSLKIKKQDTVMRLAISPRIRLAITLRYLATGDSLRSLEYLSRISRKTISKFLPEVLTAIVECLQSDNLKFPSNEKDWLEVASGFEDLWKFPHTLGAMDGKHIKIKAPPNSGTEFFNDKGFFSVVLFAMVDANSKFLYIDVGGNGRSSDTEILKNSSLYKQLREGSLNIPSDRPLQGQAGKTPYFFVGDNIFGLDRYVLSGYKRDSTLLTAEEVFNYRLSRARMPVEIAFGRLASRFRIFHRPIEVHVETCDVLVKTCCVLHNYLSKNMKEPFPQEAELPNLPETLTSLPPQSTSNVKFANKIRDNVAKYLVTDGDAPLQWSEIKNQKENLLTIASN